MIKVCFPSMVIMGVFSTLSSAQTTGYVNHPEAQGLIQKLIQYHGFSKEEIHSIFEKLQPDLKVIELIRPKAGQVTRNYTAYRTNVLAPQRIQNGKAYAKQYSKQLYELEKSEGVDRWIILGILGVETHYGRNTGNFPVLNTLATLAFDYPEAHNQASRKVLFLDQLEAFLLYSKKHNEDPFKARGSFAGAIGIPQFLPTSLTDYGKDGDGDGHTNLSDSHLDAQYSVANFLNLHGWRKREPIAWRVPPNPQNLKIVESLFDGSPEPKHRLFELLAKGLKLNVQPSLLKMYKNAKITFVDLPTPGKKTEYMIGFNNFYTLTRYNRSFFYAMSVFELAQSLQKPEIKLKPKRRRPARPKANRPLDHSSNTQEAGPNA